MKDLSMNNLGPSMIFEKGDDSINVKVPYSQLLQNSLCVETSRSPKLLSKWSKQNHIDSFSFLRRIAHVWKENGIATQYIVYGKKYQNDFSWEIVPFQTCSNLFGRVVQQIQFLWRTIYGSVWNKNFDSQVERDKGLLRAATDIKPAESSERGEDAFCNQEIVNRQVVLTGKKVNVLFSHAPIGFGDEKLHFLIVPKAHRPTMLDLTEEEYCESQEITQKLSNYFFERREQTDTQKRAKNVYIFHKNGKDAGQSVPHWHQHVIFTTSNLQSFFGRLIVFKNILLGSSPMSRSALEGRVRALRAELAQLQTT
jgi:diadenosine tetraphosphate (Ap4A) HIT family hydrolase